MSITIAAYDCNACLRKPVHLVGLQEKAEREGEGQRGNAGSARPVRRFL
jgi:hypothetical protein